GFNPKTSEFFIGNFGPLGGGWGAKKTEDGVSATVCLNDGDTHNGPNEQAEAKFPILVERFELVPDSAGAGRYRGGLGVARTTRALSPIVVNTQSDRSQCPPWGLQGSVGLCGTIVAIYLFDVIARRPLLILSLGGCCVPLISFPFLPQLTAAATLAVATTGSFFSASHSYRLRLIRPKSTQRICARCGAASP